MSGDFLSWTCPNCGQIIYNFQYHICPSAQPKYSPITYTYPPYDPEKEQLRKDLADARKWARRMRVERDALKEKLKIAYADIALLCPGPDKWQELHPEAAN